MRKKVLVVVIILLVVVEVSTMFLMYKSLSKKDSSLESVSLKEIDGKNDMFAIVLQKTDGTIEESDTFPTSGYTYDEDKSGCMDSEGNKLEGILTYNVDTNIASVETGNTSYCYLYFSQDVCTLASDSTVSAGEYGAKYNCQVDPNKDAYTFYLIDNNDDGTSDLIMNANINASGEAVIPGVTSDTGLVAWYAEEANNTNGPVTAMTYLYNATKSWTNVEPLNYTYNDREYQGITDSGYQSFVSTNGIAVITKGDGTTSTIGSTSEPLRTRMLIYAYKDGTELGEVADSTSTNGFLYNNLDSNWEYSGPYGYWTLSSHPDESFSAWFVACGGNVSYISIINGSYRGVRPVIAVKL